MDIEFIKWLVGKAEGYHVIERNKYTVVDYLEDRIEINEFASCVSIASQLLLQRVFRELVKQGKIYHDFNSLRDLIIDDEKMENWIKHIYEQEKK